MTAHSCGNTSICVCWLGNFDDASSLSMVYRDTSLDRTLSKRVNVTGSERHVLIDDLDTQTNYSIYFEQYGGCAKNQTSEPVFVVTGENGKKCYRWAFAQYVSPLFKGEWGGGSREDKTCHLSYLAFPAGITFFLASSLYPFFYIEISYIVPWFPPISPASHPSRTPTLPSLSPPAPYTPPSTNYPRLPAPVLSHSFPFSICSFKLAVANKHSI